MACLQVAVGETRDISKVFRVGTTELRRTSVSPRSDPRVRASQRRYPWEGYLWDFHRWVDWAASIRENQPAHALYWPTGRLAPMILPSTRSRATQSRAIGLSVHGSAAHRDSLLHRERPCTVPSMRWLGCGRWLDRGLAIPSFRAEPAIRWTIVATRMRRLFPGTRHRYTPDTNHPTSQSARSQGADARNRGEEGNGNWCSSTP